MGKSFVYKKDGYVFEDPFEALIPWPIARIDDQGNEIPLSMEEIGDWQDQYLIEHPDVAEVIRKRDEELRIRSGKASENIKKIKRRIEWWDNHPFLKAVCKPFIPSYYELIKGEPL